MKQETEALGGNNEEVQKSSRFSKQQAYLRSLKFQGIRDSFMLIKGSGTVHKRVRATYYIVPAIIFTSLAVSNFVSLSFGVYLKYQALTDSYYQNKMDLKYAKLLDPKNEDNIASAKIS